MELIATKRKELGKSSKKLKKDHKVPGVVFGKGMDSIPVTVGEAAFLKVYTVAGETNLVTLIIDGDKESVLIKSPQQHPVNNSVVHANFHKVNLKEKITADIPVELLGEENNELIQSGEALPLLLLSTISVEALPMDLPNSFVVDISSLSEIGAGITVSELTFDKDKVEIVSNEDDDLVVKLDYGVSEEIEEEEELTEEEMLENVEVTSEKPDDEEEGSEEQEADE